MCVNFLNIVQNFQLRSYHPFALSCPIRLTALELWFDDDRQQQQFQPELVWIGMEPFELNCTVNIRAQADCYASAR